MMCRHSFNYKTKGAIPEICCTMKVGSDGGHLVLPNTGIRLTVPVGAVEESEFIEISLSISDDCPCLNENIQTLLSPTVTCTPINAVFRKPLILTVPHSADTGSDWQICLYEKSSNDWTLSSTVGKETLNTPCYCQVEKECVYILTEYLCKFVVVGEKVNTVRKRTRILTTADESCLKLHLVADVPANISYLISQEQISGGFMVSDSDQILCIESNEENFLVSFETLGIDNSSTKRLAQRELPFCNVWHSSVYGITVRFPLYPEQQNQRFVISQKKCHQNSATVKISFKNNNLPPCLKSELDCFRYVLLVILLVYILMNSH